MVRFGDGGSIILFSSIAGSVAFEVSLSSVIGSRLTLSSLTKPDLCNVSYHSSKAGVLQLARSMACELGSKGVRVNTISPGYFKTR